MDINDDKLDAVLGAKRKIMNDPDNLTLYEMGLLLDCFDEFYWRWVGYIAKDRMVELTSENEYLRQELQKHQQHLQLHLTLD